MVYTQMLMIRTHIDKVILSREQISVRVKELARQVTLDMSPPNLPPDARITIVAVMTGAMVFCADLVRQMPLRLRISTLRVSSYPKTATSSQGAKLIEAQLDGLAGSHVLLVDDILDSGNTMRMLTPMLESYAPASLRKCVLLRKPRPDMPGFAVDYCGFDIPDEFVVGYGLDYDDHYRNLPDIVSLKPDVIRAKGG